MAYLQYISFRHMHTLNICFDFFNIAVLFLYKVTSVLPCMVKENLHIVVYQSYSEKIMGIHANFKQK